ncbi:MAG: Peptide methionine sulfoxide reductase MsrA [candidate division BRC1 bacterium ADurb.BinA364]|nr:MAG: Peptide methionine sulfoxide reductase MsrA [candidate division BRC1 bacterium ADurb.BinA364]
MKRFIRMGALCAAWASLAACRPGGEVRAIHAQDERAAAAPAAAEGAETMEKASFAAGCFWGVELAFRQLPGVADTQVGYMGGRTENPTYKDVCYKNTGHAETVEVTFDPARISYDDLLKAFWEMHDPTQVNRQGPDVGDQYRSAIFFHTPEQEKAAIASKEALERSGKHKKPIATQIVKAAVFWRAEEYHQRYLEKNGLASCHLPGKNP